MSGVVAALRLKCPRCRKGRLFPSYTYSTDFMRMYTYCPSCGLEYEVEPGFFWGAMYISYALTVGISIITAILIYLLPIGANMWVYIGAIVGVLTLLIPYNFRLSRSLMLHLFAPVQYDPNQAPTAQKDE